MNIIIPNHDHYYHLMTTIICCDLIHLGVTVDQVAQILWNNDHILALSTSLSEIKALNKLSDNEEIVAHMHKSPG